MAINKNIIKLFFYLYYKTIVGLIFTSGDHVTLFDKHIQIMSQLYNILWIWFELHQKSDLQIQTFGLAVTKSMFSRKNNMWRGEDI